MYRKIIISFEPLIESSKKAESLREEELDQPKRYRTYPKRNKLDYDPNDYDSLEEETFREVMGL